MVEPDRLSEPGPEVGLGGPAGPPSLAAAMCADWLRSDERWPYSCERNPPKRKPDEP